MLVHTCIYIICLYQELINNCILPLYSLYHIITHIIYAYSYMYMHMYVYLFCITKKWFINKHLLVVYIASSTPAMTNSTVSTPMNSTPTPTGTILANTKATTTTPVNAPTSMPSSSDDQSSTLKLYSYVIMHNISACICTYMVVNGHRYVCTSYYIYV